MIQIKHPKSIIALGLAVLMMTQNSFCVFNLEDTCQDIAIATFLNVPLEIQSPILLTKIKFTLKYPGGRFNVSYGGGSLFSSAIHIFY